MSELFRPLHDSPLREWVARWGRWIMSIGWLALINSWWWHNYDLAALGSVVILFAVWGFRLHASNDLALPIHMRLVYLRPMTWLFVGILGAYGLLKLFEALGI